MEEDDDFDLEDELERELEAGMEVDEGEVGPLLLSLILYASPYNHIQLAPKCLVYKSCATHK